MLKSCLHQEHEKKDQVQGVRNEHEIKETKGQESKDTEIQQATSNRAAQEKSRIHTSSIVPVFVSTMKEPDKEILVYALLDTQSNTTFILKVSTITSKTKVVNSQKIQGLQVRGINSHKKIKLPSTYTKDYIPSNRSHIPTSSTARSWPHLKHLAG